MRILIIVFAILLAAAPAQAETMTMYALCRTHVNIRTYASKKANIEGRILCGDSVETEKTIKRGGLRWLHCTELPCEISEGYVCADYFVDSPVTECDLYATVTASGRVAVRNSVNGKRIRWAKPGSRVHVLAYCDDWSLTTRGYIRLEFLTFEETEEPTESEAAP